MPYDHCPPSRRGHAWRELSIADHRGPKLTRTALKAMLTLRLCERCGTLGRVSNQGVVHVIEVAKAPAQLATASCEEDQP